jgi:hypothetical protein
LFVIAGLVEQGTPKAAFQGGLTGDDFELYSDEWQWLCESAERKRPINIRRFRNSFPDFEFILADERIQDLIEELKKERAFTSVMSVIEQVAKDATPENVIEQTELLREVVADVLRIHSPVSDVMLTTDWRHHLQEINNLRILRQQGISAGLPTGLKNLDHHWGGLVHGRLILVLGRPGDSKSFFQTKLFTEAFWAGHRVAIFSPEMNEHEHRARIGTLLSAKKEVQAELGLKKSFRNRALMEGHGFNVKSYKRFLQYLETRPGEMILFTKKWRRQKMTPAFIESRIDDLGIEMIVVDPIYKLKPVQKRALKHEEIADLIDSIQDISKAFDIPAVVANQAHRQMGNRGDAPHKDHSFGSDAPVHEADHVIGVKYFNTERKLILRCSKSRFGDDFRVDVRFHPNIGIMEDITPIRGSYFNGRDEGFGEQDLEDMKKSIDEDEEREDANVSA